MSATPEHEPAPTIALVRRAQGGDRAAAGELFERYAPRVRGLVALKMGQSLARFVEYEDIVQEAMADAIAKLERFDAASDGAFICWLGHFVECRIRNEIPTLFLLAIVLLAVRRPGG